MASDRYYGVYRGSVHSTKDPLNQRRIRVLVPQILGEAPTEWAWPVDATGAHQGTPAIGQGVWVMFEGGDPSFPIWTGTFGKYKGTGSQVKLSDLPQGTYPSTVVTTTGTNGLKELDLTATVTAMAEEIEDLKDILAAFISAYNSHGHSPNSSSAPSPTYTPPS